jgi:hypothetical protein
MPWWCLGSCNPMYTVSCDLWSRGEVADSHLITKIMKFILELTLYYTHVCMPPLLGISWSIMFYPCPHEVSAQYLMPPWLGIRSITLINHTVQTFWSKKMEGVHRTYRYMTPLPAKVNRGHNSRTEKVVKSKNWTCPTFYGPWSCA